VRLRKRWGNHVIRNRLTGSFFAVMLAALIPFGVLALPVATPDDAAKRWLLFIDGGDYARGWERAGEPFKTQVTAAVLQSKIAPAREPLGAIMQRTLFRVTYSNTAPGLPEGKYAAVQFSSRFANRDAAGETVWLDMEGDRWAVIAYFIGPDFRNAARPAADDAATVPGAKDCTREELVQARIARMNGYIGGPRCKLPE
jgi:hypothetical protein